MSAGNFGRSFSYTTQAYGIKATVVMPDNVPEDRVKICKQYGAKVILKPRISLQNEVNRIVEEEGAMFCHPFDDPSLISGYGSVAKEFGENLPDVIICGIGGGGLISGIALYIRTVLNRKDIEIYGVEPEGAQNMGLALAANKVVHMKEITSFVNGLSPPFAGENTLECVQKFVNKVVTVTDDEVKEAMRVLYHDCKLVVESAGAASVAAVLSGACGDLSNKRVA
eukprot:CAMPEP_0117422254 /NCGR_PEP_ID=MMETSP0758-20121206/3131_1 /TAXON_ID=63605 /ORGANISM="Percolomonas cosmopolitus, Strain AE-1 (ATCC 50343)" /LENGTH=224 /DNA_ID=CAMNT_0005204765 /DNA_START=234 /DNA_END=905 /DNA_ORIENTATION=-